MSLNNLKKELESTLLIKDWSPSDTQLKLIAKGIKDLGLSPSKSAIEKVIHEVVGYYEQMTLEGVDNSDLTTILMLATQIDNTND